MSIIIEPEENEISYDAINIADSLKRLYVAFGGNADDVATLANITDVLNAIAVLLDGNGRPTSISQAIQNIIPIVPTEGSRRDSETLSQVVANTLVDLYSDAPTIVGSEAFKDNSKIVAVSLPNVKTVKARAFHNCINLAAADLPNAITIEASAFADCEHLSTAILDKAETIGQSALYGCMHIFSIYLPSVVSIGETAFSNCEILREVVLPKNQIATLGANAFNGTKIASGEGYIYVPDDLVDGYKAATNWSTYAAQIKPISEYPNN